MFAIELNRRSTQEGWGIASNAAHPGFTKTNLQSSGPSHGKDSPTLLARFYGASRQLASFMWQEVDEGDPARAIRRGVARRTGRHVLRSSWVSGGSRRRRQARQNSGALPE